MKRAIIPTVFMLAFLLMLTLGLSTSIISLPITPTNSSIEAIFSNASLGDTIYRFDTNTNRYNSATYMNFPEVGDIWVADPASFTTIDASLGYFYIPASGTSYNVNILGEVNTSNASIEILTAGQGESVGMNLVAWNSPIRQCNFSELVPNASVGDTIYRFNTGTNRYNSVTYTHFTGIGNIWVADPANFECFDPGVGYIFTPVAAGYVWEYERI